MKKLKVAIAISMGIVLSQPIPCDVDTTIIKASEDSPSATVPANISIKTGISSAQVQATIECTDPSIKTQTDEAVADDTGRVTIHYSRVEGMSYTIELTVNDAIYTMKDDTVYESLCDILTVEGIRAGVDAEGQQTLTVTVSLADVPETPAKADLEPEKPEPETPTGDEGEQEKAEDTPKEDAKVPEKDTSGDSEQVQKVDEKSSTVAQGMPTGCRVWNPLEWLINLFRV